MKNLIILLFIIRLSYFIKAQTLDTAPWCPPGATWVYGLYNSGLNNGDYLSVKFEKDTIISGINVKKLIVKLIDYYSINPPQGRMETDLSIEYEYVSNDSLFYYDNVNDTFFLKYDFNATVGESLEIHKHMVECSDPFYPSIDTFLVNSINYDTLNNIIFQSLEYDDDFNDLYLIGKVIRNIGGQEFFYPYSNPLFCNNPYPEYAWGLIYYFDNVRGNIISSNHPIQHILPLLEGQKETDFHLNIYPNPSNGYLWVDIDNNNDYDYTIFDYSGKFIQNGKTQGGQINVLEIKNGMYYIKFQSDKTTFLAKFLRL
jgi:hypothetical protein